MHSYNRNIGAQNTIQVTRNTELLIWLTLQAPTISKQQAKWEFNRVAVIY